MNKDSIDLYNITSFNNSHIDLSRCLERKKTMCSRIAVDSQVPDYLSRRQSTRNFSKILLHKKDIINLCSASIGYCKICKKPNRVIPSAGGIYEIHLYLIIKKCANCIAGLYFFDIYQCDIIFVKEIDFDQFEDSVVQLSKSCNSVQIYLLWCADIEAYINRYGTRGFRYLFLEVGHSVQNSYIYSCNNNLGICEIGAFDEDVINVLLNIEYKLVNIAIVGVQN